MPPTDRPDPDQHDVSAMFARIRSGRRVVTAAQFLAIVGGGVGGLALVSLGAYAGAVLVFGLVLLLLLVAVAVGAQLDGLALRLRPEA